MTFSETLRLAVPNRIGLCVGLDPVLEKIPAAVRIGDQPVFNFNRIIIESTAEFASAYKPNLAFFEALGVEGWLQLEATIRCIPRSKVIIADAKRGDIGSTSQAYAVAMFDRLQVDAVTVNPYLGADALEPFLTREDKGAFVLTLTSNPGGADLQALVCNGLPVSHHVVRMVKRLNLKHNAGLVVGATKPELWRPLLAEAESLPLLVPGIGAQGGDLAALKKALAGYGAPALVNSSRSIIYASNGVDFGEAAHRAAKHTLEELLS